MYKHSFESQESMTPQKALDFLKEGNQRFLNNLKVNRDSLRLVNETKDGQYPFAIILSCMDSRTSSELIFDQGLGDIFSLRIAGNIVDEDVLGSMEYACKVAGSKLIVVAGHTGCGAIKGACDHVELGNLTHLLEKIHPALDNTNSFTENRTSQNVDFVNAVTENNVRLGVQRIISESPILKELIDEGKIGLIGAIYDIKTGIVTFLEDTCHLHIHEDAELIAIKD